MKKPAWFWVVMTFWLIVGLPSYVVGSLYKGSLIPDLPPVFYSANVLDQTIGTFTWMLAMSVTLIPVWAVPTLLISRKRMRTRVEDEANRSAS